MELFEVSKTLILLSISVIVDFITGLFASKISGQEIQSKKWNDGLIRKGNMIFAAFSCLLLDLVTGFDFMPYVPEMVANLLEQVGFVRIGLCEIISIGIIGGEWKSIHENWKRSGIVIPSFITNLLDKVLGLFKGEEE